MKSRSWIPAALVVLILAGTALAQAPGLVDRYRKHFSQLRQADRLHLKLLMEESATALRVLTEKGAPPSKAAPAEPAEPEDDAEAHRALVEQLYSASVELKRISGALQRRPLPPDGHWLQRAQRLKIPAARIESIALHPGDSRIPYFVAKAKAACYDCHRIYGGPLDDGDLIAGGKDSYKQPQQLPSGWSEKLAQAAK
ncbi:MAG: hypothetical protein KDH09_18290 [Chrysiogenetes bacterium]|nr:hypothetical protein [Chrysiogenetes bacterium]